ncbi:MAG: peptide chain release factor N(5)-glutamine methyltransferase [Actinomycetota bacterium]|nr:peptide chain release factor N(5)-glutamine methyltransferase [Actinomycetota bacterium]
MNIASAVLQASEHLEGKGISSARKEAEELLCHVLGICRVEIYSDYTKDINRKALESYMQAVKERMGGKPVQYITGTAGFRSLLLELEPGVFIPRPETEITVERSLEVIPSHGADILDLCTGSGNIAVSILFENPDVRVVATDVSDKACRVCARNAMNYGVCSRIDVRTGDIYEAVSPDEKFDCIVANPPYVRNSDWAGLEREIKEHEPPEAFLGGEDGLFLTRQIASGAPLHLRKDGWLVLEVGDEQTDTVAREILQVESAEKDSGFLWGNVQCFADLSERPRVVRAQISG